MEGPDQTFELTWATDLRQDLEKALSADQVEGFCEINKSNVDGPLLLAVFLQQLAEG